MATASWWVHVLLGLGTIALGVFALASGVNAVSTVVALVSALLLCGGTAELLLGATTKPVSWPAIIAGIASIVLGIVALAWPIATAYALAIIVGISLIAWGVYDIYVSVTDPLVRPRWFALVSGVALCALGIFALAVPTVSAVVLGFFVGILLIVQGVVAFAAGLRLLDARRAMKRIEHNVEKRRINDTTEAHKAV
jgi:uncharacterized membrane protein HdeD (DUF308 family)